ncbi:MAG: type II toxin-antitoxin system Phd/YefM family antitoxin [Burkholderiales bacterium]
MRVSVRELKTHLSKYLKLVQGGSEPLIITSRDTAMAKLSAVPDADAPKLRQLAQQGTLRWNDKKPKGGRLRPKIAGRTAASRIVEDRG